MTSWHEKDCRRPDVMFIDNASTCLSCGSLYPDNDESQEQLNKQTAVIDTKSSRLNLDWPSSITFYNPEDVADPHLRKILLSLEQYARVAHLDTTAPEMDYSEFEPLKGEYITTGTEVDHSAAECDLQDVADLPTSEAPPDDYKNPTSKKLDQDVTSGRDNMLQNDIYHALMGTDEIRLLHLDPHETMTEPLHGFLRPTKLSQRPDYVALSYT